MTLPSKGEVGLAKAIGGDVVFRPYRHLPAVLRLRQVRRSPFEGESLDPGPAFYQQPRYLTVLRFTFRISTSRARRFGIGLFLW